MKAACILGLLLVVECMAAIQEFWGSDDGTVEERKRHPVGDFDKGGMFESRRWPDPEMRFGASGSPRSRSRSRERAREPSRERKEKEREEREKKNEFSQVAEVLKLIAICLVTIAMILECGVADREQQKPAVTSRATSKERTRSRSRHARCTGHYHARHHLLLLFLVIGKLNQGSVQCRWQPSYLLWTGLHLSKTSAQVSLTSWAAKRRAKSGIVIGLNLTSRHASCFLLLLLLGGDVETNPGPDCVQGSIVSGDTISDQKSVFQGHAAWVTSIREVDQAVGKLKLNCKIRTATHNITAYLIQNKKGVICDFDDDGEYGAGRRLLNLLERAGAQNTLVVVTRWYGGRHLGSRIFRRINECATKVLQSCGMIPKKGDILPALSRPSLSKPAVNVKPPRQLITKQLGQRSTGAERGCKGNLNNNSKTTFDCNTIFGTGRPLQQAVKGGTKIYKQKISPSNGKNHLILRSPYRNQIRNCFKTFIIKTFLVSSLVLIIVATFIDCCYGQHQLNTSSTKHFKPINFHDQTKVAGNRSYNLSRRHASGLRLLLIIAGIEPNPGPVDLAGLNKYQLEKLLLLIHEHEEDFETPTTLRTLREALENEPVGSVNLALKLLEKSVAQPVPQPPGTFDQTPRTLKLPDFYEEDTKIWFTQIERMLEGQSAESKLQSLFRVLPTNVLLDSGAKASDDFDTVKAAILKFYGDSQEQKLRKMLREQVLGDRKPSTALRELHRLAPDSPDLVKFRFLEMLPETLRCVLASLEDIAIDKLAATADKMLEQMPPKSTFVSNIDSQPMSSSSSALDSSTRLQNLELQMQNLVAAVTSMTTNRSRPSENFSRDRSNSPRSSNFSRQSGGDSRSRSRARQYQPNGNWCYYHFHFGTLANKCNKPCSWKPNVARSSRRPSRSSALNTRAPSPPRPSTEST